MTALQPVTVGSGNSQLTERVRRRVFYEFLRRGIHSEDDLHFFIQEYLGYNVPRQHACPHHTSPFSFVADQYFERHKTVLGFANRNGGKTICVAILNVVEAATKPGIEILSAGAIVKQADRCYQYVTDMLFRDDLVAEMVVSSLRSETRLFNGSKISVVTGSYHGLNSPHTTKVRVDECELMHWSLLSEALQISISSDKYAAGDCLTSTRKFMNGTMQRLLTEAEEKNIKVYNWCIFDVLEPCTRLCKGDPDYGDCQAYSRRDKEGKERMLCGGKAHDLPPGGFYKIADFVKKVGVLDREAWETQWINLRPSGGALVYGNYYRDEAPFVVGTKEAEDLLKRAREEKNWARVVAVDFGSNFYGGYYMQDPRSKIWYVYNEYWSSNEVDLPLVRHAENLKTGDLLGWSKATPGFGDPSGRQAMRDLEEYGIFLSPANNAVYEGLNHIKRLLELRPDGLPGLRVFSRCVRLREELGKFYIHPLDKDGQPSKDKILKRDDHACFIAGTLIETIEGQKPIEQIGQGDLVLTRKGYRRVLAAGLTAPAAGVFTVTFSNGQHLTGTGNHPVWVKEKGWTRFDALRYGDIITSCHYPKPSFSTALNSGGIQTPQIGQIVCTMRHMWLSVLRELVVFTKRFGNRCMAQFRQDTISTIRTILLTMLQPTSNAWKGQNIKNGMLRLAAVEQLQQCWRILRESALPLQFGIAPQRAESGIVNTLRQRGERNKESRLNVLVSNVISSLSLIPSVTMPDSAQTPVNRPGDDRVALMTLVEPAMRADVPFVPIVTTDAPHVRIYVQAVEKRDAHRPVYNLTVENAHEYFANGVLVSNCDTARYGLFSYSTIGTSSYTMTKLRGVW